MNCRFEFRYQVGMVRILLISFTPHPPPPPHYCASPKPGHEFPTSYVVGIFVQWVQLMVVDIGEIDGHHSFIFFQYWHLVYSSVKK
jgi:hypothetical protein